MKLRKYSEKQLRKAVASSNTISECLKLLGVAPYGGNYDTFRKAVVYFEIDTSHFSGQSSNLGKSFGPRRNIEDYLSNKYSINSDRLRKRLIKEDIFEQKCYRCNRRKWEGVPIPLELEHIDGDNKNNNKSNLTLLCPNCHALTSTYRGKNTKNKSILSRCSNCNNKKSKSSKLCRTCSNKTRVRSTKIKWPSTDELSLMVSNSSYSEVARSLGVSDNAVRKKLN